jgi:two-component system cell cycle sensor histidine kinase/response regulator CckA
MAILIVDDEEIIRVLATKILQRSGQATLTADTPVNGLYLVSENPSSVNLVILDFSLPGMSGVDLLAEIRKLVPDMPCIFSSGYPISESDVPDEIRNKTFYLQKPYKPQQLTELVQEILGKVPSAT